MISWLRYMCSVPGRLQHLENWSLDTDELTQNLKRRVEELEFEVMALKLYVSRQEGKTCITAPNATVRPR